jgi:hypothetical protein
MIGAIPESRPFPPRFGRETVRIFPIDLAGIRKIRGSVTRDDRILPRSRFGRGFRIYPDADLAGGRGFRGSRNPDLAGIDRENPPRPPAGAISKTFGAGGFAISRSLQAHLLRTHLGANFASPGATVTGRSPDRIGQSPGRSGSLSRSLAVGDQPASLDPPVPGPSAGASQVRRA